MCRPADRGKDERRQEEQREGRADGVRQSREGMGTDEKQGR